MSGIIISQKHFIQYSIKEMVCYINFTAQNNKLNVKMWQTISGIAVENGPLAYHSIIVFMVLACVYVWEIDSTSLTIKFK